MENTNEKEQCKKCFCARCFLPIDPADRVDIEGQCFHKICSTCCICRTIPTSLKMFYGHVFCNECFKNHVLSRFKGEGPKVHSNSWWMQWAPGPRPQEATNKDESKESKAAPEAEEPEADVPEAEVPEEPPKRCICSRCLQPVDSKEKVDIGGMSFHPQCAKCYFCHAVPKDKLKIYYGQVFCEECFNRHVLNRSRDNPSEFFRCCFDQWNNNPQFADNMRQFMSSSKDSSPFVFMMQPSCKCGGEYCTQQDSNARNSASPDIDDVTWDLSFENRTDSEVPDTYTIESQDNAAEKIAKLTKYLEEPMRKKWKNRVEDIEKASGTTDAFKWVCDDPSEAEKLVCEDTSDGHTWVSQDLSDANRWASEDHKRWNPAKKCPLKEPSDAKRRIAKSKSRKHRNPMKTSPTSKWVSENQSDAYKWVCKNTSDAYSRVGKDPKACPKCLWQSGLILVDSVLLKVPSAIVE